MKKRVLVAMSGGVDSSTAVILLIKQGYEVIGATMKLPNLGETEEGNCCGIKGVNDARGVAQKLGIPFYALDYEKEFEDKVIDYFCSEYLNGRTPNPCIICNEKVKLGSLLNKAKNLNADFIATGHYASIEYDDILTKRYLLKKGKDKEKDQSYFLFSLSQGQLAHCLFPLGSYTKSQTRTLAREFDLTVHNKPGSQEICFIKDNYRQFIKERINLDNFKSGPMIDTEGNIVGEHNGIAFYTIGQRKGIGAHRKPFYVVAINKKKNSIIIGEEDKLYNDTLIAENINWIDREKLTEPLKVKAKIRYRHTESEAVIKPIGEDCAEVKFVKPQRAVTPGQAVVFYNGDTVVGGGWIK